MSLRNEKGGLKADVLVVGNLTLSINEYAVLEMMVSMISLVKSFNQILSLLYTCILTSFSKFKNMTDNLCRIKR